MGKTQFTVTVCERGAAPVLSELKSSLKSSHGRDALQEGNRKAEKLPTGIATQSLGFTFFQVVSPLSVITTHVCSAICGGKWLGEVILFWSAVDISLS